MYAVVQDIDNKKVVVGSRILYENYNDALKEWLSLALIFFKDVEVNISYCPKIMDLSNGSVVYPSPCDITIKEKVQNVYQEYLTIKAELEDKLKTNEIIYANKVEEVLMNLRSVLR